MLGLLLIYFIGKAYYELAHEYNKSRWGFAIVGVVAYYAGAFIAGIIFALLSEFGITDFFIELPEIGLSFLALPFGTLACWALYRILSNNWSNQSLENNNESLDSDLVGPTKE
jgi:hypothetical protein